ncbi:MAG: GNAT family N-acetyltransferase [Tenericutes bacterium]|nr:GNAT family N-acetyltransferase [Mycoplasmatota bacterium]
MKNIELREVSKKNLRDIIMLSEQLSEKHKKCVAPNVVSIAEASVYPKNAYHRGIFLEDKTIGFIMVFIPDEESIKEGEDDFFLWRFMITNDYQHKGYGKQAIDYIVKMAKELGYKRVLTSCEVVEDGPYPFYEKYGFVKMDKMFGEEIGLELNIE